MSSLAPPDAHVNIIYTHMYNLYIVHNLYLKKL